MGMSRSLILLIILLFLTSVSAVIANSKIVYGVDYIILLAGVKFLLVGFYYMELKDAHIAWRIIFTTFICMFCLILLIVKN